MKSLARAAYFVKTCRSAVKKNLPLIFCLLLGGAAFAGPAEPPQDAASFYETWVTPAITNHHILPTTYPLPGAPGQNLALTACPGEYEPASLVIHAWQPLSGVTLTSSDLTSDQASLPASAVDLRVVKCWYQAGNGNPDDSSTFGIFLMPELLLKDDALVKVDQAARQNYLRQPDGSYLCISDGTTDLSGIQPQDAPTLQPVDIEANTNQQFWLTVWVPDDAVPGTYQGAIRLSASNAPDCEIPLQLTVLPFSLEKPGLIYSIYYGNTLSDTGSINGAARSLTQYTNEMKDLKAHGVDYPQFNPQSQNAAKIKQELDIRKQVGLAMTGPIFNQDMVNPRPKSVRSRISLVKPYGFTQFFFYGLDEAQGSRLTGQRSAWKAIRNAGGKIYVATDDTAWVRYGSTMTQYYPYKKMGSLLDVAVEPGIPQPAIAQKYHGIGHQAYSYANPQAGLEEPETYRRNYGLALWKAGYDGAMDCAYQNPSGGSMWNDFDGLGQGFRDEVFAYPTVDGVVDTIEWEGFREAVDDVRYLATLQQAITASSNSSLKAAAQTWLNNLEPSGDLDALRQTMINYILQLKGFQDPPAPTAPVADFSVSASSGPAPLTVNFSDSSSNYPTSWSWNFGDGTSSTSQNPSHTFASAGVYTVTLSVANAGGSSSKNLAVTATTPATSSYQISPASQSFSVSGGASSINVMASPGSAAWTAASNDAWLTVTSPSPLSGSGVVYYQVSRNTTGQKRTGTMTIAGHTFTVTQSGALR
jgi:PKD repeat protein